MKEYKIKIIKLMQQASYRHGLWVVYSDFLEMTAIAISNVVDMANISEREKRYMEVISKYSKDELNLFPRMIAELVLALEEDPSDILGELFMELELSSRWKGQFFTPMSICRLAGYLIGTDFKSFIEEKGYITVNEPASGGGAMIIGLALSMKEAGYNPQKQMVVTAADLDIKSVHMTYIQLTLLGIPAVVCHANSLTVQVYSNWYTPNYVIDGWLHKELLNKITS